MEAAARIVQPVFAEMPVVNSGPLDGWIHTLKGNLTAPGGHLFVSKNERDVVTGMQAGQEFHAASKDIAAAIPKGRHLELEYLAVHPDARDQKAAKQLMQAAEQFARDQGYDGVVSKVYASNPHMARVLDRWGHQRVFHVPLTGDYRLRETYYYYKKV